MPLKLMRFLRPAAGWILLLAVLTGCSGQSLGFISPQGPIARAQLDHFWFVVALLAIVIVPVLVLTPLIVWRYRYGNPRPAYRPQWDLSIWLDIFIWGVPLVVVAILSVVLWRQTHHLDPYRPIASDKPPLEIQVVGYDWKWLFIYPEQHIATMGQLVLPVDRPVAFDLTSATVLQTFFIPALGSQIDVMNRMQTKLHLLADSEGEFEGRNMQYNGDGFHEQRFIARAVSAQDFDRFVADTRREGIPLDHRHYRLVARKGSTLEAAQALGINVAVPDDPLIRFSTVPDGLFHAIMKDGPLNWSTLSLPASSNAPSSAQATTGDAMTTTTDGARSS